MLFKQFADIDAFPICLATKDVKDIVKTVKFLEPTFGGVMLEDISAPRCFAIEDRLKSDLTIPVLHDDQHATAVAATAGLINALKVVGKRPPDIKVVIVGAGAAGTASAKLFMQVGVENIVACDRRGAIHRGRDDLNEAKRWFAENANPMQEQGSVSSILAGADVFLGVSGPGVVSVEDIAAMREDAIVFALANPIPEVLPEHVGNTVAIVATGRSDYPNQIDCSLCYPGIFRGALDCRAREINDAMKLAAAFAIAGTLDEASLHPQNIIPNVFDPRVVPRVREAVIQAAIDTGAATMQLSDGPAMGGSRDQLHYAFDVVT